MHVSVLIPTHNRIDLLTQTLSSLRDVHVPSGVSLEVIVIANACTDGTQSKIAGMTGDVSFDLTVAEEPQPGQNHARNKGIELANGEILAFVDDDIRFDENWLQGLVSVFEQYDADVVGGRTKLWWEVVEQPDWFEPRLLSILAGYDHGTSVKKIDLPGPIGANVAIHRRVYKTVGKFDTATQDHNNPLYRGNEVGYFQRADEAGFTGYYAPDALVYHWVSPDRVTSEFFERSGKGFGYSRVRMKDNFGPLTAGRSILGFTYLLARHSLAHWMAGMVDDRPSWYYHLYAKNVGAGGLLGSWIRLREDPSDH
jgi:glycosyltransferase involved in cell wall biosynthesis